MNVANRFSGVKKIFNQDNVYGIKYALRYAKWFLTVLSIWPYVTSNSTKVGRYVSKITLTLSSLSAIVILPIPTIFHIILRDTDNLESLMLVGPIIYQVLNVVKQFLLFVRSDLIKLCFEHMEEDWRRIDNTNDQDIMIKNLKIANDFTKMCTIGMYGCSVSFAVIVPLCSGSAINELNETVKRLPFPGLDKFFDLQNGVNYEIALFGFCISALFLCTIAVTVCNLTAVFVTHACGQIQIVISRIETLVRYDPTTNDSVTVKRRINFIIQFHVRILRFSSMLENVLEEICLLEVGVSVVIICILQYTSITAWHNDNTLRALLYFACSIALSLNIFVFCHFGGLLTEEFRQIGKSTYLIDWYRLPGRSGLNLILIIAMANCPRKLTAGGIIDLSIYSFGNIMKTSFTYLNLLLTVAQ